MWHEYIVCNTKLGVGSDDINFWNLIFKNIQYLAQTQYGQKGPKIQEMWCQKCALISSRFFLSYLSIKVWHWHWLFPSDFSSGFANCQLYLIWPLPHFVLAGTSFRPYPPPLPNIYWLILSLPEIKLKRDIRKPTQQERAITIKFNIRF